MTTGGYRFFGENEREKIGELIKIYKEEEKELDSDFCFEKHEYEKQRVEILKEIRKSFLENKDKIIEEKTNEVNEIKGEIEEKIKKINESYEKINNKELKRNLYDLLKGYEKLSILQDTNNSQKVDDNQIDIDYNNVGEISLSHESSDNLDKIVLNMEEDIKKVKEIQDILSYKEKENVIKNLLNKMGVIEKVIDRLNKYNDNDKKNILDKLLNLVSKKIEEDKLLNLVSKKIEEDKTNHQSLNSLFGVEIEKIDSYVFDTIRQVRNKKDGSEKNKK